MQLSRRHLLQASAVTAGALALPGLSDARGLLVEPLLTSVTSAALEAAKKAGASYADVRIHRRRNQGVSVREDHVESVSDHESYGVGVRVLVDGAWGFAAASK